MTAEDGFPISIWEVVKIMGPFWIPSKITAPNFEGTQNGTTILKTTHIDPNQYLLIL